MLKKEILFIRKQGTVKQYNDCLGQLNLDLRRIMNLEFCLVCKRGNDRKQSRAVKVLLVHRAFVRRRNTGKELTFVQYIQ